MSKLICQKKVVGTFLQCFCNQLPPDKMNYLTPAVSECVFCFYLLYGRDDVCVLSVIYKWLG